MKLPPIIAGCSLIAALTAAETSSPAGNQDDLVRAGLTALDEDRLDDAATRFAQAAERATDPGLVAFNSAALAFRRGDYRLAEQLYLMTLSDTAVPTSRRAQALYNRGVCLLRGGDDTRAFRTAIDCFAAAGAVPGMPAAFQADVRHNLELAKLKWFEARARSADGSPSGGTGSEHGPNPEGDSTASSQPGTEPAGTPSPGGTAEPGGSGEPGQVPIETTQRIAGAGTLPVLDDRSGVKPLSLDEARAVLAAAAARIRDDRRSNARLVAGPEHHDVRDW